MSDKAIALRLTLRAIYQSDKEFSEAFESMNDAISKETNDLIIYNLKSLRDKGYDWTDYKHRLAYSNEMIIDVYNAVRSTDVTFKCAVETAMRCENNE